ncbi:hypothetical protein EC973_004774 [Apophysomyces ossiformis]|uniref:Pentatricopeptide repeat-containing protein n=1 Tax=Apophysomyces ossiformis TaxID=679940 RepID=A0A8H7ERT1_9FUNG|nr:hypothetical protein EC973_004774 [Apophysomyces ossiformis]
MDVIRAIISRPMTLANRSLQPSKCHRPLAVSWKGLDRHTSCSLFTCGHHCRQRRLYTQAAHLKATEGRSEQMFTDDILQQAQQEMELVNNRRGPKARKKTILRKSEGGNKVIAVTGWKFKQPKRKPRTEEDYNRCIAFTINDGMINKAIKYLREMEKSGIKPRKYAYTMIINGFTKNSDMDRAKRWLKRMKMNGIKPDVYTYSSMIDGYMRTADVTRAEAVFREMMKQKIKPELTTYNIMMHHAVRQLDIDTAVTFWERLRDAGLDPDVYTYAIMIHGLGQENQVDQAWRMYDIMKRKGIDVNGVIATTLMGIHVKHHDNEHVIKLFRRFFEDNLRKTKITPTAHTRNVMLNAILGSADLATTETYYNHYLESLKTKQSTPLFSGANVYTYTTFMRAFLRRDAVQMVGQVYQDMIKQGVKPTVVTYSVIMLSHAFVPDPDTCSRILEQMKRSGVELNVVLYTIVMRAWGKAGRFDKVKEVYEEMKAAGIQPTQQTMSVIQQAENRGLQS